MNLFAHISNEAYNGSHKVHKDYDKCCEQGKSIPKKDRYTFERESAKGYNYLDTIVEIKEAHPTFNVIPCPDCQNSCE